MTSTSHIQTLRAMLREKKGVILPGAPNALAARIIADLGFKAVYLTGAGLTNMHPGANRGLEFVDRIITGVHVERRTQGGSRRLRGGAEGIVRRETGKE
jgi:2-methylisocitrate lyase-like PEP mutase family enzyme